MTTLNDRIDDCLTVAEAETWVPAQLEDLGLDEWTVWLTFNEDNRIPAGTGWTEHADRCIDDLIPFSKMQEVIVMYNTGNFKP